MSRLGNIALILGVTICLTGCEEPFGTRTATRIMQPSHAYEEQVDDPTAIATVRSVAVFPFANVSGNPSLNTMTFSDTLAQQFTRLGLLQIVTPLQVDAEIRRQQRDIDAHNRRRRTRNLLGKQRGSGTVPYRNDNTPDLVRDPDVELVPIDPIHNEADAIRVGRMLKVDAIIMGTVTTYDPYYRPRVGVILRAISTGQNNVAADALTQLTQWGIPRGIGSERGQIWLRQQMFDSNEGATARDAYLWARNRHTEANAYDTEVYLRSIERYFEFVSGTLAKAFLNAREEAIKEAERRAKLAAKQNKMTPEGASMRIKALTRRSIELPDSDMVIEKNHSDNIDRSWRPDVYLKDRPDKATYTTPDPSPDMIMRTE